MAKILIVGKQPWTTKDRVTGKEISGDSYIGYLPNGNAIKFTSKENYVVYAGEVGFDANKAVEVNIITKIFDGKISYQDGASYGKDEATA